MRLQVCSKRNAARIFLSSRSKALQASSACNPEFAAVTTIRCSGKENSSGGAGSGAGRASYQGVLNKSLPENMAGTITFTSLQKDRPVSATYELATLDGKKKYSGKFDAVWG